MTYKLYKRVLLVSLIAIINLTLNGQSDKELLKALVAEEQEAVNALVLYPKDTRMLILEATQYPEALIKIESIQNQTSETFRKLLSQENQDFQKLVWDLTRYPGLINGMTKCENQAGFERFLAGYPDIIHERAQIVYANSLPIIKQIDRIQFAAESALKTVLDGYPQQVKDGLNKLIALPEVLSILTDNVRLTLLVGDLYHKNKSWLLHKIDSLNLMVVRQNAIEMEDWKTSIESNPEAYEELSAAAENFSKDYGYDDIYYSGNKEENYENDVDDEFAERSGNSTNVIVQEYYNYNFPYWFGYPHWYTIPRWRLNYYWYDWGFYYGPQNGIIVFGLPSYHFTHWYFHHPHHHVHWPHLSAHFIHHYHGHRRGTSSITSTVTNWERQNRTVVSRDWMKADEALPSRFVEYGKFETERVRYNERNPKDVNSQRKFIERKSTKYPSLSKAATKNKNGVILPNKRTIKTTKERSPKERLKYHTEKSNQEKIDAASRTKTKVMKSEVNTARDHHKNKWEQPSKNSKVKLNQSKSNQRIAPNKTTTKKKPSSKNKVSTKRKN